MLQPLTMLQPPCKVGCILLLLLYLLSSYTHQVRATESKGQIHQMWYDLEGVDGTCNSGPDVAVSELQQPATAPLQPATPRTQACNPICLCPRQLVRHPHPQWHIVHL